MAGDFVKDPALCKKYAQFASHMDKWQFTVIYWSMFVTNLIVLFMASWTYTKATAAMAKYGEQHKMKAKSIRLYVSLCLGCVCCSTVIVVMEAYALLALQFCDGEDLMSLYWSTWTMIQVGSLIAMVGIIVALFANLGNRNHPPWALALGTPVLVIAGILHLFHDCTKRRVKKMRKSSTTTDDLEQGPPISQVNTIAVNPDEDDEDDTMHGEFVGFTTAGGPIVRFTNAFEGRIPENAELLGYCQNKRPIVAYRKESIKFLPNNSPELEPKRPAEPSDRP